MLAGGSNFPVEYVYKVQIPRSQFDNKRSSTDTSVDEVRPWLARYTLQNEMAEYHACRKCYYTRLPADKKDLFLFVSNFVVNGK